MVSEFSHACRLSSVSKVGADGVVITLSAATAVARLLAVKAHSPSMNLSSNETYEKKQN